MANIYCRSTDGLDTDTGGTWPLAKATLAGAAAIDVAGDNIYLSQAHAESFAGNGGIALAGTTTSPTIITCANDAAEPPTAGATGATLTTTGNNGISFSGACFWVNGLGLTSGSGGTTAFNLTLSSTVNARATYKNCPLVLATTSTTARIDAINNAAQLTTLEDCTVSFAAVGQGFRSNNSGLFIWNGGGLAAGSAAITTLFVAGSTNGAIYRLSGLDLTAGATGMNIFNAGVGGARGLIRNAKLPAGWTGSLTNTTNLWPSERYEMYNCDSGDTNYRFWVVDFCGNTKHFTGLGTVDVTGSGRYSGTTEITRFSWILTTNTLARWPMLPHEAGEMFVWNDTIGTSKTATVEVIHDSLGSGASGVLNEADLFLRLEGQVTSGSAKSTITTDGPADALNSGVAQATSTTAWAGPAARANIATYAVGEMITLASNPGRIFICKTAGMSFTSEPGAYATAVDGDSVTDATAVFKAMRRNKLTVIFTPAERGWVIGTPIACKASAVFYLDPNSFAVT